MRALLPRSRPSPGTVAGAVAVAALAAAAARLPAVAREVYDSATAARGPALRRDLEPAYEPQRYLLRDVVRTLRAVPPGAVYTVAVGPGPNVPELVRDGLVQLLGYALLPRRYTPDARAAQWVITWDVPPRTLGVRVLRAVAVDGHYRLLEVRR